MDDKKKYGLLWLKDNIDEQWIVENPVAAKELIGSLISEYYHMKDIIINSILK